MNLKRFLWKTFSIQKDEYSFIFPLFLLYFISGSFFASGQIYSETIFLKAYGAKGFARFFVYNGIAIIFAGLCYNYILLKMPLRRGYFFLTAVIVSSIAMTHFLQDRNYAWLPFYIYMGNYLFTFFLDIHFFNYAFQFLSIRNSKRLLPFLMGAGKLGGIISSVLIYYIFSKDISQYGTIVWALNAVFIIIPLVLIGRSRLSGYEKSQSRGHELLPDYKLIERIIRRVRLSISSPIFSYTVLAVLAMSVVNQISEYYFAKIFNSAFATKNELSSFLSLYTLGADFLTLIFQFFIISRVIRILGVQKSNLVYPATFLTLIAFCAAFPGLVVGILLRFFRKNLSNIIKTPIYNIIMAASPRDRMTEVKSFISDIVSPIGMIAGGGAILLIYKRFTPPEGYIFSTGIGVLFVIFTLLQNRAYLRALKSRLSFDHARREAKEPEPQDYEEILSDSKKIQDNLEMIEVIFNEKPFLDLLPHLYPYYDKLMQGTKENILNLLKTGKSDLTENFIILALKDPEPLIRGKALSLLAESPYGTRKKLLESPIPGLLESEKYAASILLARDGKTEDGAELDDFALEKFLLISEGVSSGRLDPVETVIILQVLPYHLFLKHFKKIATTAKDLEFFKIIIPYADKLTSSQARKILYTFKDMPIEYLTNFLALAKNAREMDRAVLLDHREIDEEYMKHIFNYDERTFQTIINRLFKNKNFYIKSNYLNYILALDRKPVRDMVRFMEYEIDIISAIYELKNFTIDIVDEDPDEPRENFIKLSFLNIFLDEALYLQKRLILKVITILSGLNIDDIHEANILLKDRDMDSYILEFIESDSSIKNKNRLLSVFDEEKINQKRRVYPEKPSLSSSAAIIKNLISLLPGIPELLTYTLSGPLREALGYSENRQNSGGDNMISLLEKIIFLKKNKLFSELKIDELLHIAKITNEIDLPRDKIFINRGDRGTQLFILLSGEVEVYTGERVLAKLGPGSCIGELSIIDEEPRSASVKTTKKTKILSVNRNDFLLTLKENPSISINIMQVITKRMREQIGRT